MKSGIFEPERSEPNLIHQSALAAFTLPDTAMANSYGSAVVEMSCLESGRESDSLECMHHTT